MRKGEMIVAIVFRKVTTWREKKKKRSGLKSMRIVVNIRELYSDSDFLTRPDPARLTMMLVRCLMRSGGGKMDHVVRVVCVHVAYRDRQKG